MNTSVPSLMKTMSSGLSLRRRRICVFMAVMFFMFTIGIYTDRASMEFSPEVSSQKRSSTTLSLIIHRKLLNQEITTQKNKENETAVVDEPNRIWSEKCSKSDILISQGATEPLPNGIPTYTVEIMNVCFSGCNISAIHLSCGWFSSARLVNPRVLKRLHFDDCLVNGGKPLVNGHTLSFKYANTFRYQLTVSSITC